METDDKRQQAIERLEEVVMSGGRIPEKDVGEILGLARDHTLLLIAKQALQEKIPDKDRTSLYNVLQNAVERHELVNKKSVDAEEKSVKITLEIKSDDGTTIVI